MCVGTNPARLPKHHRRDARHRADLRPPMHRRSAIFGAAGSPAGGALRVRSDRGRLAFGNFLQWLR